MKVGKVSLKYAKLITAIGVLFLPVLLLSFLAFGQSPGLQLRCDQGVQILPPEARVIHVPRALRLETHVHLDRKHGQPNFVLELVHKTKVLGKQEVKGELVPSDLEILFMPDLDANFLLRSSSREPDVVPYLAAIWSQLLSLPNLEGKGAGDDVLLLWIPGLLEDPPVRHQNVIFNRFVTNIHQIPERQIVSDDSSAKASLDSWLNRSSNRPRVAVILRWRKHGLGHDVRSPAVGGSSQNFIDEYGFGTASSKGVPLLIADIDPVSTEFYPAVQDVYHGLAISLGEPPLPLPTRVEMRRLDEIAEFIRQRIAPFQERLADLRREYRLVGDFFFLVDASQMSPFAPDKVREEEAYFRVTVRVPDEAPKVCEVPIRFTMGDNEKLMESRNLIVRLGILATLAEVAAIIVLVLAIYKLWPARKRIAALLSKGTPRGKGRRK